MEDPIQLMRECVRGDHGMSHLRIALGIGCEAGWQMRCLEALANQLEAAYIKLPVDADGVPIRPGDEMRHEESGTVHRIDGLAVDGYGDVRAHVEHGGLLVGDECRHVKPDTVEGLLEELYRIEPHEADCVEDIVAEFSERIRKAVQDGQAR